MLRWINRILFVLLLLIHVGVLFLWASSMSTHVRFTSTWPADGFGVGSSGGIIAINIRQARPPFGDPFPTGFDTIGVTEVATRAGWFFRPGPDVISNVHDDPRISWWSVDPWMCEWLDPGYWGAGIVPRPIGDQFLVIHFPHWFAAAVSGVMVWPWIGWAVYRRRRARRRDRAGLCPKCGYDMRANPARCSECGCVPQLQKKTRLHVVAI
jgi:hypothetical protein